MKNKKQKESYKQIKAERDAYKWFVDSIDGKIFMDSVVNGKHKHQSPAEIFRRIKAGLYDLQWSLKEIRNNDILF